MRLVSFKPVTGGGVKKSFTTSQQIEMMNRLKRPE
jgi:hypothetical protein